MRAEILISLLLFLLFLTPGCASSGVERPPDLAAAHRRIEMEPRNGNAYLDLARLYFQRGDLLRARQYHALAERFPNTDNRASFRLGVVIAVRSGLYDDAITRCRQRLERDEDSNVRVLLATMLESTNRLPQAEREWQILLASHPNEPRYLIQVARFYQRSGRPDWEKKAVEHYQRYLAAAPSGAEAQQARAALFELSLSEQSERRAD